MSLKGNQNLVTYIAGADLSALQYTFVKLDTDTTKVVASITGYAIGILQNSPKLGEEALVAVLGSASYLVASAAITAAAAITPTTGGKGVTTTQAADFVGARAVGTVTFANSIVEVVVTDFYYHA